jgi:hypothetical protein
LGLDVPVNDSRQVRNGQSFGYLPGDTPHLGGRQRAFPAKVFERTALHILEDEVVFILG